MKIKPGKTYWAANRRPLYCDGVIADSPLKQHIGLYRMRDLLTSEGFVAFASGYPADRDDSWRVTTKLHWRMALEMVCISPLTRVRKI